MYAIDSVFYYLSEQKQQLQKIITLIAQNERLFSVGSVSRSAINDSKPA